MISELIEVFNVNVLKTNSCTEKKSKTKVSGSGKEQKSPRSEVITQRINQQGIVYNSRCELKV